MNTRTRIWTVMHLVTFTALAGCYTNAGPVITDVRIDHGTLRYVRCDLILGKSLFTIGNDDLEHCVDESGRTMSSPTPDQPYALVMPVSPPAASGDGTTVDPPRHTDAKKVK